MKNRLIKIICAMMLALSLFVLAACNDGFEAEATEGFTVSGIIMFDNDPLANVEVFADETPADITDSSGIFVAEGLQTGCKISFSAAGYVFSPAYYVVGSNVYDLNVKATKAEEPDTPDVPDNPNVPDNPDPDNPGGDGDQPGGDPVVPPEPEIISPVNVSFIIDESGPLFVFALDVKADGIKVSVEKSGENAAEFTVLSKNFPSFFDDNAEAPDSDTIDVDSVIFSKYGSVQIGGKQYREYSMSASRLLTSAGIYKFSVSSVYGEKFSQVQSSAYQYTPALPPVEDLRLENRTLFWSAPVCACGQLNHKAVFGVYLNGTLVAELKPAETLETQSDASVNTAKPSERTYSADMKAFSEAVKSFSCDLSDIIDRLSSGKYEITIKASCDKHISSISAAHEFEIARNVALAKYSCYSHIY